MIHRRGNKISENSRNSRRSESVFIPSVAKNPFNERSKINANKFLDNRGAAWEVGDAKGSDGIARGAICNRSQGYNVTFTGAPRLADCVFRVPCIGARGSLTTRRSLDPVQGVILCTVPASFAGFARLESLNA